MSLFLLAQPTDGTPVSSTCSATIDCLQSYELCVSGICVSAIENTGVDPWVIGTIAIAGVLFVRRSQVYSIKLAKSHATNRALLTFLHFLQFCTVISCVCLHPSSPLSKRNAHPRDKRLLAERSGAGRNSSDVSNGRGTEGGSLKSPLYDAITSSKKKPRKPSDPDPLSLSAPPNLGSKSGVKRGWNRVSWAFPLKSGGTESFEDSGKIFVVRRPQTCPEIGRGRSSSSRRQSTSEATKRDSSVIVVQERHMSDADNVVTTTAL